MHAERYVLKLRAAAVRWWFETRVGYLRFAQRWLWRLRMTWSGVLAHHTDWTRSRRRSGRF